jgi:negative regulator of replication initiation
MPTIRIDDDVWTFLQSKAIPLQDTPNDVLRRELKIGREDAEDGSGINGHKYQAYDRSKVRSLCIALGDAFHRDDVREFSKRLIHELCDEGSPAMTDRTFKQLARWCKTGGAYEAGMEHAQKISMAVFGRIVERR